jgi:hypothetical protein
MRGPLNVKLRTVTKQRNDSFKRMKKYTQEIDDNNTFIFCICAFCWYIKELITIR